MRISPSLLQLHGKGRAVRKRQGSFGSFLGLLCSSIPFLALLLHNDHSTSIHTDFFLFIGEEFFLMIEGLNPSPERSTALKREGLL
jgi:hypothetical protein